MLKLAPVFVFLFLFSAVAGQSLPFRQLKQESGLQSNNINCIFQDDQGFLWFGSENGLHRYDGINFNLFEHDPNDSNSIAGNAIFRISEDENKDLWIGTNNGFDKYDRSRNIFIHIPALIETKDSSFLYSKIYSPASLIGPDGIIYASLGEYGIFTVDKNETCLKNVSWINSGNHSGLGTITAMFCDKSGNIWLGSQNEGLFKAIPSKKKVIQYRHGPGKGKINSNNIFAIFQDQSGKIWVGTGMGLNLFDPETESFEEVKLVPNQKTNERVQAYTISGDVEGNVWFGSNGNGIFVLNTAGEIFNYSQDPFDKTSLSGNFIRQIYKDVQGNLWVATREEGINYVLNNNALIFNKISEKRPGIEGLSYKSATSILQDDEENFWIGTDGGGIDRLNIKTGDIQHILIGNFKTALTLHNEKNELWFGGYLEGFTIYNTRSKTFTSYKNKENDPASIAHNDVRCILKDREGNYWIGTNGGGLNLFNRETGSFFPH